MKSLSSASEQMVFSTALVAGRKPKVVDCLSKASRRLQSGAWARPHYAGDACDDSETQRLGKIVCRASIGRPWCRRVRSANNNCAQDRRRLLTYCATENFLLTVTPTALISSTLGMIRTAGARITTARRHLGYTKTIPIEFTWFRRKSFELAQSSTCLISPAHDSQLDAGTIR